MSKDRWGAQELERWLRAELAEVPLSRGLTVHVDVYSRVKCAIQIDAFVSTDDKERQLAATIHIRDVRSEEGPALALLDFLKRTKADAPGRSGEGPAGGA